MFRTALPSIRRAIPAARLSVRSASTSASSKALSGGWPVAAGGLIVLLGGSAVAFRVFERNGSQRPVLMDTAAPAFAPEPTPIEKASPIAITSDDPHSSTPPSSEDEEVDHSAGQSAAYNPVTGEINWDCPCLGGMADGPCGEEFKAAFSCFIYSEEEPKGVDCVDKFRNMQTCFRKHPEIYGADGDDYEEEETPVLVEQAEKYLAMADEDFLPTAPTSA